ncbi:MAG: hypothetical protein ABI779_27600 [Acidobacteriota bacterium]
MSYPASACVCVSVCCPHFEDKRELLLGLAEEFMARGVATTVVLAGKSPCSHIIRLGGDDSKCELWFNRFKGRATASVATEVVGAQPLLEAEVEDIWKRIVDERPRVWETYRLDLIARVSIMRRRLGPLTEDDQRVLRDDYEKDTLRHLIYYRHILRRSKAEVMVYFGGQFHQDHTAFLATREARISAYAIEKSFVPGCVYFDEAGVTGARGAIGARALLHETKCMVVAVDQRVAVDQLMARSFHLSEVGLPHVDRARIRGEMGLGLDDRLVLFLGQIEHDSSLITDGGAFSDQGVAVSAVHSAVLSLSRTTLVVRPHPKSKTPGDMASAMASSLGLRVVREEERPLPTLLVALHAADVVVTVNSQAGLQAAWLGIPVVTLGHAFYSGQGFTVEAGGHLELLQGCLAAALSTSRGAWQSSAVSYISAIRRHMVDRPTPAALATRILTKW